MLCFQKNINQKKNPEMVSACECYLCSTLKNKFSLRKQEGKKIDIVSSSSYYIHKFWKSCKTVELLHGFWMHLFIIMEQIKWGELTSFQWINFILKWIIYSYLFTAHDAAIRELRELVGSRALFTRGLPEHQRYEKWKQQEARSVGKAVMATFVRENLLLRTVNYV